MSLSLQNGIYIFTIYITELSVDNLLCESEKTIFKEINKYHMTTQFLIEI